MKHLLITMTLLTSLSASADTFNVCTGIKNLCNETVKLFTETISTDRVEGLYRCQVMKNDCNELLTQISESLDTEKLAKLKK